MTKDELVAANEKLVLDKELLREDIARLNAKLAATRAVMES